MWRAIVVLLITGSFVFFLTSLKLTAQVALLLALVTLAVAGHFAARARWLSVLFYAVMALFGFCYTFAELGARAFGTESTMNTALVLAGVLAGLAASAGGVLLLWRSDTTLLSSVKPKAGILSICLLFVIWEAMY